MDKYFFKTQFKTTLIDEFLSNLDNFAWTSGDRNTQWEVQNLNQELISKDPFLYKIHKIFPGKLNFFKFPPKTNYIWHKDGPNLFNFNLIFRRHKSLTFFESQPGDYNINEIHYALKPIVLLDYEPEFWYIFNAQINHSVLNLSDENRYLLTYNVRNGGIHNYNDALKIIKNF